MSDSDRIPQLMEEAAWLPFGEVKVQLLDEAVRLADTARDIDAMFKTRMALVKASIFSGQAEKAIPAYAWCLAQYEAEPDRFRSQEHSLLWYFKNILHNAHEQPQLSREQIESLREQMGTLYRQHGYNQRPVHYTRFVFATRLGNRDAAKESFVRFQEIPRDDMADCLACEADGTIEYYELINEPEKVIEEAQPSLDRHRTCAEVPHRTFSYVLRSHALLGRYEEGDECQYEGYRLIRNNPSFLRHVGLHICYLVHRKHLRPALNMAVRHMSWALTNFEYAARYQFYIAARRIFTELSAKPVRRLSLPENFPLYNSSSTYEMSKLIEWFDNEIKTMGQRFDERNGNTFFSKELVEIMNY